MKNIEILMQTEFDSRIVPIKFDGYDKMVMLAGTPVDSGGKFANGATAIGILIEDVTRSYPYGEIVVSGFVDYEAAKKYSEVDYTKECMTALKNIVFEGVGDQWIESGGGVTSWNDIKDKPFGETERKYVILPQTVFDTYVEVSDSFLGSAYKATIEPSVMLSDDETYKIKINDVEYEATAYDHEVSGEGFRFYTYGGEYIFSTNEVRTVEIYQVNKTVHKLDPKFLPDEVVTGDLVIVYDNDTNNVKEIKSQGFEKIYDKIFTGIPVKATLIFEQNKTYSQTGEDGELLYEPFTNMECIQAELIRANTTLVTTYYDANIDDTVVYETPLKAIDFFFNTSNYIDYRVKYEEDGSISVIGMT